MAEQHSPETITRYRDFANIRKPISDPGIMVQEPQIVETGSITCELARTAFLTVQGEDDQMPRLASIPLTEHLGPEEREGRKLGIVTYADSETGFELTVTDTFLGSLRQHGGMRGLRQAFKDLSKGVLNDPFGDHSIDHFSDTDAGRWARVVHRIPDSNPLASLVPGKKLAIKTTGMDMKSARQLLEWRAGRRSKLTKQFRDTRELIEAMKCEFPEGLFDGLIDVADVYAVLREPKKDGDYEAREWMLMEYIPDAQPVENKRLVLSRGGSEPGFETAKYPELLQALNMSAPYIRTFGSCGFRSLVKAATGRQGENLEQTWRLTTIKECLSDLRGDNILQTTNPDGKHYTLIDIQKEHQRY